MARDVCSGSEHRQESLVNGSRRPIAATTRASRQSNRHSRHHQFYDSSPQFAYHPAFHSRHHDHHRRPLPPLLLRHILSINMIIRNLAVIGVVVLLTATFIYVFQAFLRQNQGHE